MSDVITYSSQNVGIVKITEMPCNEVADEDFEIPPFYFKSCHANHVDYLKLEFSVVVLPSGDGICEHIVSMRRKTFHNFSQFCPIDREVIKDGTNIANDWEKYYRDDPFAKDEDSINELNKEADELEEKKKAQAEAEKSKGNIEKYGGTELRSLLPKVSEMQKLMRSEGLNHFGGLQIYSESYDWIQEARDLKPERVAKNFFVRVKKTNHEQIIKYLVEIKTSTSSDSTLAYRTMTIHAIPVEFNKLSAHLDTAEGNKQEWNQKVIQTLRHREMKSSNLPKGFSEVESEILFSNPELVRKLSLDTQAIVSFAETFAENIKCTGKSSKCKSKQVALEAAIEIHKFLLGK